MQQRFLQLSLAQLTLQKVKLDILSLIVKAGLAKSRSEARRAVEQGGVSVNDEKVTDIRMSFAANEIPAEGLVIKKGKKNFKKIVVA